MNIIKCTKMHPILLNDVDFATFLGNFLLIDVRYIDIIFFYSICSEFKYHKLCFRLFLE